MYVGNEFCRHKTQEAHGGVKGGRKHVPERQTLGEVSKEHRKGSWRERKNENVTVTEGAKNLLEMVT